MYALVATVLALTGAAVAAPTVQTRQISADFKLHATAPLLGWALINSQAAADRYVIQLQRPSVYTSDVSYFNGTNLYFKPDTETLLGVRMPAVTDGYVAEVISSPGQMSPGFAIDQNQLLTWNFNNAGFWACPSDNVFVLMYGLDVDPAKLPSTECLNIQLVAVSA
ncbi:hypothetical protein GGR54DRAFT_638660 [Hypoxylon sp. NC1633]|nr:hypothetical protein GGR54DRAFT_638660 [Hypoxylon sp. NC1633]